MGKKIDGPASGAVGSGLLALTGYAQPTISLLQSKGRCTMNRVVAYIDGFNLYFGLKADHGRNYR
jgi:hypothetical protein